MKRICPVSFFSFLVVSLAFLAAARPAAGQTLSGTLSNFDVFNQTGHESHGFEIELDGISSQDIASTFGGTYIRYGDPGTVDFPGGALIRYASPYDSVRRVFTVGTPVPPSPITATSGHSCWTGGAPGYPTSGCEHFGASLFKNPTAVHYRWLIEDPANPGVLVPGPDVSIASPLWSVIPGAAGGAAVVNAAIAPPEIKAPRQQFPAAVWVKVYETETDKNVELNHLLTDDAVVPQSGTPEVEWEILQSNPKKPNNGALQHGKPLGKGNQSVIRRFEFYQYTGLYSAEGEASACSTGGKGSACAPQAGELGDYIGAQMAAAQFGQIAAPKAAITAVSNGATGQAGIASGSWVSIYGSNLSATTRSWQNSDFQGANLPVALDGVSVTINGKAAAVAYISPGQLNVQAPANSAAGPVPVQVTNSLGAATATASLQNYAPGFFALQGKYVVAVHTDSMLVAPAGFFGGAVASRPAQPGETLLLFGTGFGPTTPAVSPGQIVTSAAALTDLSQLHVRIGGVPATVQYAGIVFAGEYQFNVIIPALPDGDQTLVADIGGVPTQSGLLISIKN